MRTGWKPGLCSGQAAASWGPVMEPDRPGAGMEREVFPVTSHQFHPAPSPSFLSLAGENTAALVLDEWEVRKPMCLACFQ